MRIFGVEEIYKLSKENLNLDTLGVGGDLQTLAMGLHSLDGFYAYGTEPNRNMLQHHSLLNTNL